MPDVKSVVSREELDAVMETAKQSDQLVRPNASKPHAGRTALVTNIALKCVSA